MTQHEAWVALVNWFGWSTGTLFVCLIMLVISSIYTADVGSRAARQVLGWTITVFTFMLFTFLGLIEVLFHLT